MHPTKLPEMDSAAEGASSFHDWAAEQTLFPIGVAEMALAHTVNDKVEAAYRRGDLVENRRELMEAWARYCQTRGQHHPPVAWPSPRVAARRLRPDAMGGSRCKSVFGAAQVAPNRS